METLKEKDIQPVGARVLIRPYESATKSKAGLIMENSSNVSAAPVRGTVITSGRESKFMKGQQLMFRRYSTDLLKVITPEGEKEFSMVEDEDVLCIISNKDNFMSPMGPVKKGKKVGKKAVKKIAKKSV